MTISVVIPAYNAEKHIARAIDSVLAQTRKVDEIIVVDDGSSDNTGTVIKNYGDKVIYILQENAGAGAARNTGVEAASSEWIAFLDSDDEWLPEKIKLQAELLSRNSELFWCYSNCLLHCESKSQKSPMLKQHKAETILSGKEFFDNYLHSHAQGIPAWTGTLMVKKDALVSSGLFNPDLPLAQDIDLWFRIAYRYPKVGFIAAPLAIYNTETPGSNVKRFTDISHICRIIDRHIKLSAKKNCFNEFQPCIFRIVNHWVLMLSKAQRYSEMRKLIKKYRRYLPARYYIQKNIRALFPGPVGCYNKLVAKLKGK